MFGGNGPRGFSVKKSRLLRLTGAVEWRPTDPMVGTAVVWPSRGAAIREISVNRLVLSFVVCASFMGSQAASAGLKVGDAAPALSIKHWLKGDPIDLSKAAPGQVYVVEFWATWCGPCVMGIPHMSELQDHFKSRNVTFVGISDEKKETVEKFLAKGYDARMRYGVAIDDEGKTNKAWMEAAGRNGIPCAFIVKEGKVQWIGHPMEDMDMKIAELCGDKEYVQRKEKLGALTRKLMESAQAEKWDAVHEALVEYVKLEPKSMQHQLALYHVLLVKLDKSEGASAHGQAFVESTEDADGLNALAWVIAKHDDFDGKRDMKLALSAAEKAMRLTKEEAVEVLDTYALVLAETGKLKDAVKYQEKAVAKCPEDDARMKRELVARLDDYKKRLGA